jgi:hypothetical protein
MIKKMMVTSAALLMVFSFSGNVMAGKNGSATIKKKTRTQSQQRIQKNKNCDGPQKQTRKQTRSSY